MTLNTELGFGEQPAYTESVYTEELAFEQPRNASALDVDIDIERSRSFVSNAALVSGACLGTMALASVVRGKSPLEPLQVLARGIGIGRPSTMEQIRPLVGLGIVVGGAVALVGLQRGILGVTRDRAPAIGRIASAVLIPAVAFLVDSKVMGGNIVGRLGRMLGPTGLFAKYASMGVASAFAR